MEAQAQATAPELRPLGVGEIVDVAIKIYWRNALTLFRIVLVVVAPVQLVSSLVTTSASTNNNLVTTQTNPITGEQVIKRENVPHILSAMMMAGLYDGSGGWAWHVGIPAKSGVGGGIIAVLPGQLGIGVFSPRLDEHGNSHRGIRVCEELSSRLQLHLLDYRGRARPALRRTCSGSEIRSRRIRSMAAQTGLDVHGTAISLFEFQGNLFFGNTEQAVRRILERVEATYLILDLEEGHVDRYRRRCARNA